MRVAAVEEHLRHRYRSYCTHVTPTESLSPAITAADSIVILVNSFVKAGVIIDGIRDELMNPDDECITLLVNGEALAATDLMHALVDRIARLCQTRCPLEEFEDCEVSFSTYSFRCSTYVNLSPLQQELSQLRYMDRDPCAFMLAAQLGEPWIGPVSVRHDDGARDIYDDQGVGFVNDFLSPIGKLIRKMLLRLAHTHRVAPDDLLGF
ncbi:g7807 [Coccomyxa viridis]|uniref:G7807 protein n=1 Tax=Coccomyxa viridis TaxID=1274662 RepID=A0ABP1G187_9CHLO